MRKPPSPRKSHRPFAPRCDYDRSAPITWSRTVIQEIEDISCPSLLPSSKAVEIETPYLQFEALNIPGHHPVRDDMDTFIWTCQGGRPDAALSHATSPVQIRTMKSASRPCASSCPQGLPSRQSELPTPSCSTKSKDGLSTRTSPSAILHRHIEYS